MGFEGMGRDGIWVGPARILALCHPNVNRAVEWSGPSGLLGNRGVLAITDLGGPIELRPGRLRVQQGFG